MTLVQASDAARLSGLTSHQLREWCGRRGVVTPDVPPCGRGKLALFSWQTILALRVLSEMHQRYGVVVGAWRIGVTKFQHLLKGCPFPVLWGTSAVFPNTADALISGPDNPSSKSSFIIVPLDPHLEALASPGDFPSEAQLPLFPAFVVNRREASGDEEIPTNQDKARFG